MAIVPRFVNVTLAASLYLRAFFLVKRHLPVMVRTQFTAPGDTHHGHIARPLFEIRRRHINNVIFDSCWLSALSVGVLALCRLCFLTFLKGFKNMSLAKWP